MPVLSSTYRNLKGKYEELEKKIFTIQLEHKKEISSLNLNKDYLINQLENQKKEYEEKLNKKKKEKILLKDLMIMDLEFEDEIFKRIQRPKNESHLEDLYNRIWKRPKFINAFHIAEYNNKLYLIDGQHRYTVCKNIIEEAEYDLFSEYNYKEIEIDVKIIKCNSQEELIYIYETLNYNHSDINTNTDDEINWKEFQIKLLNKYQKYFKSDKQKRCNKPYLRINDFIRKLQDNLKIIDKKSTCKYDIYDEDILFARLEGLNMYYYYKWLPRPDVSGLKTIRKMFFSKNIPMFFFGIENNWLNDLIDYNNNNLQPNPPIDSTRISISSDFREEIFRKYIGTGNGNCMCCIKEPITRNNFHVGHIIAVSKGGKTNIDNLRPICGHCNVSMGNKNMFDFMIDNNINIEYGNQLKRLYNINPSLYVFFLYSNKEF